MAFQVLPHPSSFRDPSGFVFTHKDILYRQINVSFKDEWEAFLQSGLCAQLVANGQLIPHETITENLTGSSDWYQTIQPELLAFVSYPYEWTFGMLKDAALLTLDLAIASLAKGFILKDASAYNVQLCNGRMTFIDSLSFVRYVEGEPWIAYRQFCEQFLAPLALSHYSRLPCNRFLLAFPDGIPLQYASRLLPFRSKTHLQLYLHLHLHAKQSPATNRKPETVHLSKTKLLNVLNSLRQTVLALRLEEQVTVWGDYYAEAAQRGGYLEEKIAVVQNWLASLSFVTAVDVGGNTGEFARMALAPGNRVICADGEHAAVENLYQSVRKESITDFIPVVMDFTAPSPGVGLNNTERLPFLQRATSDLVMALAVVHHLSIGKNLPFTRIAELLLTLGRTLLIEWVPKDDEKVQLLLQHKKDIYYNYHEEAFLLAFEVHYSVLKKHRFQSGRTLYLMQAK